ncbi:hypothetical protein ACF05X_21460, partial [Streptomyces werraensis]
MGDGLDGVVEAVAVRSAVAEDLVVPRAADHMLHSGTHFLTMWEDNEVLTALLRVGVTNDAGAERMR